MAVWEVKYLLNVCPHFGAAPSFVLKSTFLHGVVDLPPWRSLLFSKLDSWLLPSPLPLWTSKGGRLLLGNPGYYSLQTCLFLISLRCNSARASWYSVTCPSEALTVILFHGVAPSKFPQGQGNGPGITQEQYTGDLWEVVSSSGPKPGQAWSSCWWHLQPGSNNAQLASFALVKSGAFITTLRLLTLSFHFHQPPCLD